ncbi:MAG: ribosomal protein S4E [Spirosomataceae bacterium]|jgi:ribosomal protein S4E
MKKLNLIIALLFCTTLAMSQKYDSFGEKIKAKGAVAVDEISTDSDNVKITGEVESVCVVKGCWMKLKLADGKTMRVTFKDYGFFVPMDIVGKEVVMEGNAKVKETSVEDLQHYAKDAGKSADEIAKITEGTKEMAFEATGVLVKK